MTPDTITRIKKSLVQIREPLIQSLHIKNDLSSIMLDNQMSYHRWIIYMCNP